MAIRAIGYNGTPFILVDESGEHVELGAELKTFRDEPVTLVGALAPHKPGSTGRIIIRGPEGGDAMFYPSVCDLRWKSVQEVA